MLTFFSDMMGAMRKLPTWVFFWVNVVLSTAVIVAFVLGWCIRIRSSPGLGS